MGYPTPGSYPLFFSVGGRKFLALPVCCLCFKGGSSVASRSDEELNRKGGLCDEEWECGTLRYVGMGFACLIIALATSGLRSPLHRPGRGRRDDALLWRPPPRNPKGLIAPTASHRAASARWRRLRTVANPPWPMPRGPRMTSAVISGHLSCLAFSVFSPRPLR